MHASQDAKNIVYNQLKNRAFLPNLVPLIGYKMENRIQLSDSGSGPFDQGKWRAFLSTLALFCPLGDIVGSPYADPPALAARHFPEPEVQLHTPGSANQTWTPLEDARGFMKAIADSDARIQLLQVGWSAEGLPVEALFFDYGNDGALTLHIQARVHGNEPASTEGALELAWQLAYGELAQSNVDILLIPVLNPEGTLVMERVTGRNIDGNRDYVLQNSRINRIVYQLLQEYDPEVVLDMHETRVWGRLGEPSDPQGATLPFDMMAIGPNNPNLPPAVIELANARFMPAMRDAVEAAGLRFAPYELVDFHEGGLRVRESATTFVSAKNALALGGRVSLLTEGRGIGIGDQHFVRRTLACYLAAKAVVETAVRNAPLIQEGLQAARAEIALADTWILRTEPRLRSDTHPLLRVESNAIESIEVTYWGRSQGKPSLRQQVPAAYLIEPGNTPLIKRLSAFGLEMEQLIEAQSFEVEMLEVAQFEQGEDILYGGLKEGAVGNWGRRPQLRNHLIEIKTHTVEYTAPAGSFLISANQRNALYLLTLEPGCLSGFAALGFWGDDLPVGFRFPIKRVVGMDP
jgi:hypothetical protein